MNVSESLKLSHNSIESDGINTKPCVRVRVVSYDAACVLVQPQGEGMQLCSVTSHLLALHMWSHICHGDVNSSETPLV